VQALQQDLALRDTMGARGHQGAAEFLRWPDDARAFVAQLERWAGVAPSAPPETAMSAETAAPGSVTLPVTTPDDR
jgi:hypothetical protein